MNMRIDLERADLEVLAAINGEQQAAMRREARIADQLRDRVPGPSAELAHSRRRVLEAACAAVLVALWLAQWVAASGGGDVVRLVM